MEVFKSSASVFLDAYNQLFKSSEDRPSAVARVAQSYFSSLNAQRGKVDGMFLGSDIASREEGSRTFMHLRKEAACQLFTEEVCPQIEAILTLHGETRPFNEVVSIFGFNRLFMREIGSAGTDVDCFMLIDTDNQKVVDEIRKLMAKEIAPALSLMGIDMETSDFLMIRMGEYEGKLSQTYKSLFTLANTGNVDFITGSKELLRRAFTLSNEQLATHFVELLVKNERIPLEQGKKVYERVFEKISKNEEARKEIVALLKQMASCELYIGKTPYKHKKTIQTELKKVSPKGRRTRTADLSIKFNFNRIADMYLTVPVDPKRNLILSSEIMALEKLGMVLSNIKCRVDDEKIHPLLKVQETYSSLNLEDIEKMLQEDRAVVGDLLKEFNLYLDPKGSTFAEDCYDALWVLSDRMESVSVELEEMIYSQAIDFVPINEPQPGISWLTIGLIGVLALGGIRLGIKKYY